MVNLYINQRRVGEVIVLDLKGRARMGGTTIALHRSVRSLVDERKMQILLDLAGVTQIDSVGLGELIASRTSVTNRGGEFKLLNVEEPLRELMTMTKVLTVFDVYDDEQKAVASFAGEGLKIVEAA